MYHAGELMMQKLAGAEGAAQQNGKTVRSSIPQGAAAFLAAQTLVIAASVDARGNVWCSLLTGEPGFIKAADERTVTIRSQPAKSDPLLQNLLSNHELGLLVIDLGRRNRLRINGNGRFDEERRLVVTIEQIYGNCPKYIRRRALHPHGVLRREEHSAHRSSRLDSEQLACIRNADTFFIGSVSSEGKADASHRGGPPGFIRAEGDRILIFPDYYGNSMFNTLGNIYSDPHCGLLFIDFDHGHTLQLTGRAVIVWDEEMISLFPGAERLVRFEMDEALFTQNDTPFGWRLIED
ncbi:pyridoxamine 5'-phosphate oxidase family protein [Paenibacillus hamazuiensis]|uniref:pyridoxamine 5'-phosphate oxidase family protein n=1 Tax=Paenibacillus hamazuiensis TaxID=2936508 RepID=UPI00200CCA58|nr:pyridoxamine 5'-phosphate oxidase family protein [Paenibacillus hamazuiensis]